MRLDFPWTTARSRSPDGGLLASGSADTTVRLWRLPSKEPAGTLTGHTEWVWGLVVSPDGRLLASGSVDKTVRWWQLPSGAPAGTTLTGPTQHVGCLAVSPDGGLLASVASEIWDKTVRLWRLPSGAPAGTLTGHTRAVTCLAVSPDGGLLASGSYDETVRLWQSTLSALSRTPVDQISLTDIQRLHPLTGEHSDDSRGWVELIETLVRWRHRHDIEIDAELPVIGIGDWEIELDN